MRAISVVCVCLMGFFLAFAGCDHGKQGTLTPLDGGPSSLAGNPTSSDTQATQKPATLREVSDVVINTTVLLTGAAARVEAGPLGPPQDEESLDLSGIQPWGPVQAIHEVIINGVSHMLYQLASPDPFTATFQLSDGTITVSNEPLDVIVTFDGDEGPEPDRVEWVSDYSDTWEVLPGRIDVYFDTEITELELWDLIDEYNLAVVMSWFEPPDGEEGEGAGASLGGSESGTALKSTALADAGTYGESDSFVGAGVDYLTYGNEIAWFDFEYDQSLWTSPGDAYEAFKCMPHVTSCCPHITDYGEPCYQTPDDPLYNWYSAQPSMWIDSITGYSQIPLTPYSGRQQVVAVIDDGVYRNHEDLHRIMPLGVESFDHSYRVASTNADPLIAVPNYKMDKDRWQNERYYHRLLGHGTQVASTICASTNNAVGVPSMAPTAMVLPIRMKYWTKFYKNPFQEIDTPTFSINAHVKAVRALRFEFAHEKYSFMVRVVNMSWAYPSFLRNLPWPWNGYDEGFKTNVSRDLKKNDRLYIAAAGNHIANKRYYPAAHSNVLGVTGYLFDRWAWPYSKIFRPHPSSNWSTEGIYPVSGFWDISKFSDLPTTYLPVTPLSHPSYSRSTPSSSYLEFDGTSAAAAHVSALAYHLYSIQPNDPEYYPAQDSCTYLEVRDHIISNRLAEEDEAYYKGPVCFARAITTWPQN